MGDDKLKNKIHVAGLLLNTNVRAVDIDEEDADVEKVNKNILTRVINGTASSHLNPIYADYSVSLLKSMAKPGFCQYIYIHI